MGPDSVMDGRGPIEQQLNHGPKIWKVYSEKWERGTHGRDGYA